MGLNILIIRNWFVVLFFLTATHLTAQNKIYKEVPENLHGFWQFKVENKGDWNGMHVGKTYIEIFYDLAKIESVTQKEKIYTLHISHLNGRKTEVTIELKSANSASFTFKGKTDKSIDCKRFDADPDIKLLPVEVYSKAIKGKWIFGNNIHKLLFIDKDQLMWNNKKWQILWLGEYLQKEFRALIKENNHYELIYITPIDEKSKKLVFGRNTEYYQPMPPAEKQNRLYGTWCDAQTNEWIVGFFDKIAVYKNQSWFYKIVENKDNTYYIVELIKGGKKQTLSLKLTGKEFTKCELTDSTTKQNLFYTPRPLAYNYPDNKPFVDSNYKTDTVTINGYLHNLPNRKNPFKVTVPSPIKDKEDSYFADIDENGCFTLKFPVLNTTEVFIDWLRSNLLDVVEPGETYFLYIDYAGNSVLYGKSNATVWQMGKNARLHREINTFSNKVTVDKAYPSIHTKFKSHDKYRERCQRIYKNQQKISKQYIADNPMISERFKILKEKQDLFQMAFCLMQRRFQLNYKTKERFSKEYMQEVNQILKEIPTPSIFLRDTKFFLEDYVDYCRGYQMYDLYISRSKKQIFNKIEKKRLYSFNDEQKEIINKADEIFKRFKEWRKAGKDSIYIANQTAIYKNDLEKFNALMQQENIKKVIENFYKQALLTVHKQILDSITISQETKNLSSVRLAFRILDGGRQPLSKFQMDFFNREIKNKHLKKLLQEEQQKYIELDGKSLEYEASLKLTDHLKEAKDADELLKKLTEPYLGKVIYIDFWGTWCGPCKIQMKHAKKVKEALKDKDVIFMYFANRSPKKSWKNVIKQYEATGKNVVHYNLPKEQQAILERRLGVKSYPTFMIMDKKGKIVDVKPARPMQTNRLIKQLNEWLKK